jgi:hypothetical protein
MIRAVVAFVDRKGQPPPELKRVFDWRNWGALPRAGGSDDQRYGELDKMLAAANVHDLWKMHKGGNLKRMTKEQIKMLRLLKELLNEGFVNGR